MDLLYHFPLVVDWTQVSAFKACPTKWFYKHVLHLNSPKSVHLHFGAAYAEGLEITRHAHFTEGMDSPKSIAMGQEAIVEHWGDESQYFEEVKNRAQCLYLHELYFMQYPMETDSYPPIMLKDEEGNVSAGIEFNFMEPLDTKHPELNTEILYTGRADMVTSSPMFGKNAELVFDDKTTGAYLSDRVMQQWEMRGQFTGYCWGLRRAGHNATGAVISMASVTRTKIAFDRVETPRTAFQLNNWERDMQLTVKRMVEFYNEVKEKHFELGGSVTSVSPAANHSDACLSYARKCWFMAACTTENGEDAKTVGAEQSIWLPHEQRNGELREYLTTIGLDPKDWVWKQVNKKMMFDF